MLDRRDILRMMTAAGALAGAELVHAAAPPRTCNAQSTGEEVTRGLDLSGLTAVVTGCNSGIGFETMRVLALRGAHVIGAARTKEKGEHACARVKGRAMPVVLELADFPSVVACADHIRRLTKRVDILILNAGIVLGKLEQVYGLEKQFVVNHLGHFLFANRLLDLVTAAPQGRVVTVGSGDHRKSPAGGIQFENLSGEGWSDQGYAHSKLANGLFSLELARRLGATSATSNCLRPGHVRTNILRRVGNGYLRSAKTSAQGAATVCYVATHPSLAKVTGQYFSNCALSEQSEYHQDLAMAAKLWEVSDQLTRKFLVGARSVI